MANEQQKPLTQTEVNAILRHWPADFSGRLLVGVEISDNRSLECSDFRGAVLRGCTFSHCKFDNSDFSGADLGDSKFIRCKMEYCHFGDTQMEQADFDRCALVGSTGINGDTRMQSEVIFDDMMGHIPGADPELLQDWRQYIFEHAGPVEDAYGEMLWELQMKFHECNDAHPGMGAELFNGDLRFLPDEFPAFPEQEFGGMTMSM